MSTALNKKYFQEFATIYRSGLQADVLNFWLKNGLDREFGGILTCLDRQGKVYDTDKSVWFQGRAGWMFAATYNTCEARPEYLEAAISCVEFLRKHCYGPEGKLYYSVTQDGKPLRMRRYVYSESFAAIAYAATHKATGNADYRELAIKAAEFYLKYSFTAGLIAPKTETSTRPMRGIGGMMIGIVTCQEIRTNLGDVKLLDKTCTQWIDGMIADIEKYFVKEDLKVVMEAVNPDGSICDHIDGRTLNPGHAIEAAWFIMNEGKITNNAHYIQLGAKMLDWMWEWGWDKEHGGIIYFRDVYNKPFNEYWHDMKFWWPQNEAIIATLLAYQVTGDEKYASMHAQIHHWTHDKMVDKQCGEWFGYLHRDGRVSTDCKGNLYKGPFHIPRMQLVCWKLSEELVTTK